ncbi:hypothetical protein EMCRGX_G028414 [Ephydatia muelleri]
MGALSYPTCSYTRKGGKEKSFELLPAPAIMQTEQYTIGSICIAKESYQAKDPSELTFEQGDVLTIVEDSKGFNCRQFMWDALSIKMAGPNGSTGLVPVASTLRRLAVSMVPMPWFHGTVSRFDAEKLLDRNKDGQFLLRAGQHPQGVYALAVSCLTSG